MTRKQIGTSLYLGLAVVVFAMATQPVAGQDPAIQVVASGNVGFGTTTPNDGDGLSERFIEVESREDARLVVDSGDGPGRFGEFMFQRGGSNTWSFGNENSQFYIYNYDRQAYDLTINRVTGNVVLGGTCTDGSGGADGCDGVFEPTYNLPSIEEHAEYMWKHKHLPAVGPTPDGERIQFSVQDRHFAVLNELEKAHIYVEQLHERLKALQREGSRKDDRIEGMEQRLAHLESLLRGDLSSD